MERVVPGNVLEGHESAGKILVAGSALAFALSVLPLLLRNRRAGHWAGAATLAASLVVLGLGYRTGRSGGELVYRFGAARAHTSFVGGAEASNALKSWGHHDEKGR